MGTATDITKATMATTAMPPGSITITITTSIARSSGTARVSATVISTGGMAIRFATATGRRGAIRIDKLQQVVRLNTFGFGCAFTRSSTSKEDLA